MEHTIKIVHSIGIEHTIGIGHSISSEGTINTEPEIRIEGKQQQHALVSLVPHFARRKRRRR